MEELNWWIFEKFWNDESIIETAADEFSVNQITD